MPLIIPGQENSPIVKLDLANLGSNQFLKTRNSEFISERVDSQSSVRCLFVGQREYATVSYQDPVIDIIGSDDATTCHIALLVDETTLNASLCHLDGTETDLVLDQMVNSLKNLNKTDQSPCKFSIYLAGGFIDKKNSSFEITTEIFDYLMKSKDLFELKLALVSQLNDQIINNVHFPIAYGLGYNIKEKRVFMCNRFVDKGPDQLVRSAKHFSQNSNMNIYDPIEYKLIIGPFTYSVNDYIPQCVSLPDRLLLKYFSTSPEQEPAHFVGNLRETFKFMLDHPRPLDTYFEHNSPHIYTKDSDGSWKKC